MPQKKIFDKLIQNLKKDITLNWKEVLSFGLSIFSGGILLSIYLHEFFSSINFIFRIFLLILGLYSLEPHLKNKKKL